jgi:hypothetical protein
MRYATFQASLDSSIEAAYRSNPGVSLSVARPPSGGRQRGTFTCEQNPFETTQENALFRVLGRRLRQEKGDN